MTLDSIQVRVLGALIEKEITTPEAYPLSLNALVNACNQKSSRDPVMDVPEDEVRQALHVLEDADLVTVARDSRVAKFEHRIRTVLNLRRDETALLCLLMLRGAQTPGELRSRSDRMFSFDDLQSVESTLARLASRQPSSDQPAAPAASPLVVQLPRQPGSREARWMQLLGGAPDPAELSIVSRRNDLTPTAGDDRVAALEAEVASLREAIVALEHKLEMFVHRPE